MNETQKKADELANLDPEKVHPDVAARIRGYVRVRDNKASERAINAHAKTLVDAARVLGTDEPEKPVRPVAGPKHTPKKTAAKKTAPKKTAARRTRKRS